MTLNVLVTGANGFVGRAVTCRLKQSPTIKVQKAIRSSASLSSDQDVIQVGDIHGNTDWMTALTGVDVIIHCAARVHVMREASDTPLELFRIVNVEGTRALAKHAVQAGVKRFVFVSSIKVNGEQATEPYSYLSKVAPVDPYGISKMEAEAALWDIAAKTGLEVVVVRPPLVYGPMVRANFLRLMQLVKKQVPLPFGAVRNRRSMIFVSNLADLLYQCVVQPAAAGKTFLASDGRDLSTADMVRQLAEAMQLKPRLLNVPTNWMRVIACAVGKADFAERLLGSLAVDISYTCETLNWTPPFSVEQGMKETVTNMDI